MLSPVTGQLSLLVAFVTLGYAACAFLIGAGRAQHWLRRSAWAAAGIGFLALTLAVAIVAAALVRRDFRFAYVAGYASRSLSWDYALSALWVGQAGSLLLWSWMSTAVALAFYWHAQTASRSLREQAFGVLLAFGCFLVVTMVFAADPMESSVGAVRDGRGLSPILQHPSMLVHPPMVFLGYAAWSVPFALVVASLRIGGPAREWIELARPWMLIAWMISGSGILLGAHWAYQELGWGGYWGWDPVENGSLIPWLLGTAAVHSLMAWRFRGVLKKTTILLIAATFAMCNFATFLTRSGIFSSLHAFSQSPIGWLFLALMSVLLAVSGLLLASRWSTLQSSSPLRTLWCRESMVTAAVIALVSLAAVTCAGTISSALSDAWMGSKVIVGPSFYNMALIPVALVVLPATAAAPLLNWKVNPTRRQRRLLALAALCGLATAATAGSLEHDSFLLLAVYFSVGFGLSALATALVFDWQRTPSTVTFLQGVSQLRHKRTRYGGYLVHLGLLTLAVGVASSSLETSRRDTTLRPGESVEWAGRTVRLAAVRQRERSDRLIAEVDLEIATKRGASTVLRPARHYHRLREEWTNEVAIWSTWRGDFYTIVHGGDADGRVYLTLVDNPGMAWLWLGGWVMAAGCVVAWWPGRRRRQADVPTAGMLRVAQVEQPDRSRRTTRSTGAGRRFPRCPGRSRRAG